ncbi:MAG: DUF1286 domain-containing protein [Metallosphaera sp.]
MKLVAHYVFTTGVLALLSSPILGFYEAVTISFFISWTGNTLIDRLGHELKGGYIRRTPRTHTLFRSLFWGVLPSIPLFIIFLNPLYLVMGGISGPSHLLLDVFTEKGIYRKKNGRWIRFALAHFSYNNPLVNGLAILIGGGLIYLALILQSRPI